MRIDKLLVAQGLAPSRAVAQQWLSAGLVSRQLAGLQQIISKPSTDLDPDTVLHVAQDELQQRYVSRGGLKMHGALAHTGLDVHGWRALDLGISTGGFSDCLLQHGVARCVGVDVGHGQLATRLQHEPRLRLFEGANARHPDLCAWQAANDNQLFDIIVADVSFISLSLVLPPALPILRTGGHLLSLVKPQFEAGRAALGKGGIVRDASVYAVVREKISQLCHSAGLQVHAWFDSPITGGDGNREFFIHAQRST